MAQFSMAISRSPITGWSGRRNMKRAVVLVGLMATALVLASCADSSPVGQTPAAAESALKTLPGVEDASVSIEKDTSGLSAANTSRAVVILKMDSGTTNDQVSDAEVDFILQTGWSMGASRPLVRGVTVGVDGAEALSVGKLLDRAGWVESGSPIPGAQSGNVPARLLEDPFGKWPGKPSETYGKE
ncbi:hypothetical protein [Curtobacterium sp. Curtsp57]|uniref:hypothetical protein n=1 Tax=Curtobacterium sp. Curtsp57 TaxID=3243047 RepID=UPI0039B542FB